MSVRERLHWSIEIGSRAHSLDILPAMIRRSVAIALDGHTARRIPKPTAQRPWRETAFEIDGQTVAVALIWADLVMETDVFVAGRSLIDDRTLEAARANAPDPMSDYDMAFGRGLYRGQLPARRSLLPAWMALAVVVATAVIVALFAMEPRPRGPVIGLVIAIALGALAAIWFRSWFVVMDRAHLFLSSHPELGDLGRQVRFFGAFLGYPLAWGAALAVVIAVLDR